MSDTCPTCGQKILWVTDQNGTKLPLNKTRVRLYVLTSEHEGTAEFETGMMGEPKLRHISHFVTCPQAASHSRGGRR